MIFCPGALFIAEAEYPWGTPLLHMAADTGTPTIRDMSIWSILKATETVFNQRLN